MAVAEKGLMVLDCIAYGKAGHAAREEGENAIYKALPDIDWFKTYRFIKVSPLLGEVKMSVTIINAGSQHNVVPAECSFTVDVRVNELLHFLKNYSILYTAMYLAGCSHAAFACAPLLLHTITRWYKPACSLRKKYMARPLPAIKRLCLSPLLKSWPGQ